jgi:hypothetical protein
MGAGLTSLFVTQSIDSVEMVDLSSIYKAAMMALKKQPSSSVRPYRLTFCLSHF